MSRKSASWGSRLATLATVVLSIIWLMPLIFSLLMSFRPMAEPVNTGNIFFGSQITLENYQAALRVGPWLTHYINTLIFVGGGLIVQLMTLRTGHKGLTSYS